MGAGVGRVDGCGVGTIVGRAVVGTGVGMEVGMGVVGVLLGTGVGMEVGMGVVGVLLGTGVGMEVGMGVVGVLLGTGVVGRGVKDGAGDGCVEMLGSGDGAPVLFFASKGSPMSGWLSFFTLRVCALSAFPLSLNGWTYLLASRISSAKPLALGLGRPSRGYFRW